MIAVLKKETTDKQLHDLIDWLESMDLKKVQQILTQ